MAVENKNNLRQIGRFVLTDDRFVSQFLVVLKNKCISEFSSIVTQGIKQFSLPTI
jgi:hypothetical protein